MSLLALTGKRTIGRMQVVSHGTELDGAQPALDLDRKYEGSHEDLAKLLKTYAAAPHLGVSRDQLFRLVTFNHAVHNSDAHLKNYAMLYRSTDDARLAPAYDILTVPAYPEFHHGIPGLTLYGKKTWSCGKLLLRYAQQWLDIRAEAAKSVIEQVSDALRSAAPEVKQYADGFAEFREVGKRMLEFWDRGIIGIQPDSRASVPSSGLRETTGLSDPKPRRRRRRNPFRSKDGGFSHKVR